MTNLNDLKKQKEEQRKRLDAQKDIAVVKEENQKQKETIANLTKELKEANSKIKEQDERIKSLQQSNDNLAKLASEKEKESEELKKKVEGLNNKLKNQVQTGVL